MFCNSLRSLFVAIFVLASSGCMPGSARPYSTPVSSTSSLPTHLPATLTAVARCPGNSPSDPPWICRKAPPLPLRTQTSTPTRSPGPEIALLLLVDGQLMQFHFVDWQL